MDTIILSLTIIFILDWTSSHQSKLISLNKEKYFHLLLLLLSLNVILVTLF